MRTKLFIAFFTAIAFMFSVGIAKVDAEIREGVVVDKRPMGVDARVFLKVNLDDPRPYDHTLRIVNVRDVNFPGAMLDMMLKNGVTIKFEDSGMDIANGIKSGDQRRIIFFEDKLITDIFPQNKGAFPYAQIWEQGGYTK